MPKRQALTRSFRNTRNQTPNVIHGSPDIYIKTQQLREEIIAIEREHHQSMPPIVQEVAIKLATALQETLTTYDNSVRSANDQYNLAIDSYNALSTYRQVLENSPGIWNQLKASINSWFEYFELTFRFSTEKTTFGSDSSYQNALRLLKEEKISQEKLLLANNDDEAITMEFQQIMALENPEYNAALFTGNERLCNALVTALHDMTQRPIVLKVLANLERSGDLSWILSGTAQVGIISEEDYTRNMLTVCEAILEQPISKTLEKNADASLLLAALLERLSTRNLLMNLFMNRDFIKKIITALPQMSTGAVKSASLLFVSSQWRVLKSFESEMCGPIMGLIDAIHGDSVAQAGLLIQVLDHPREFFTDFFEYSSRDGLPLNQAILLLKNIANYERVSTATWESLLRTLSPELQTVFYGARFQHCYAHNFDLVTPEVAWFVTQYENWPADLKQRLKNRPDPGALIPQLLRFLSDGNSSDVKTFALMKLITPLRERLYLYDAAGVVAMIQQAMACGEVQIARDLLPVLSFEDILKIPAAVLDQDNMTRKCFYFEQAARLEVRGMLSTPRELVSYLREKAWQPALVSEALNQLQARDPSGYSTLRAAIDELPEAQRESCYRQHLVWLCRENRGDFDDLARNLNILPFDRDKMIALVAGNSISIDRYLPWYRDPQLGWITNSTQRKYDQVKNSQIASARVTPNSTLELCLSYIEDKATKFNVVSILSVLKQNNLDVRDGNLHVSLAVAKFLCLSPPRHPDVWESASIKHLSRILDILNEKALLYSDDLQNILGIIQDRSIIEKLDSFLWQNRNNPDIDISSELDMFFKCRDQKLPSAIHKNVLDLRSAPLAAPGSLGLFAPPQQGEQPLVQAIEQPVEAYTARLGG